MVKGACVPLATANAIRSPKKEAQEVHKDNITDSLLVSGPFPAMVWNRRCG